jgi:hypothetical protein
MIPQNEISALMSVIQRLEETPPLTALQIFRKEQERRYKFSPSGNDPDVHAHQRKYSKRSGYQPRDKNHPIYGDTHFALGFQARYLDAELNDWFAWAHSVIPGIALRITAILKRAKLLELRARFQSTYDKHFLEYWKHPMPRTPSGDEKLDWLIGDVPRLDVTLKALNDKGNGEYSYTFEFCCRDCGGYTIDAPDGDDDNGPAVCAACEQVFGTMSQVKELAQRVGQLELIKRGLFEDAIDF